MLKLVFAETGLGPTLELGPFPAVRIDGETMRAEPRYWQTLIIKSASAPAA